jgi:hypothetical protein
MEKWLGPWEKRLDIMFKALSWGRWAGGWSCLDREKRPSAEKSTADVGAFSRLGQCSP